MSAPRSELVRTLVDRGYLHQATDLEGLDALAAKGPVTGYIGFDATADSLHVGSLVQIMMLRRLQQCGHRAIALMGGGTTKIGDPSGKDEQRRLLDDDTIAANIRGIGAVFERFLSFKDRSGEDRSAAPPAMMVNNADWLDGLGYIRLLREVGPHFTVNRMLTFDSVRLRLDREQPLTFLEFNYMILQAYDFLQLAREYDCRLQLGGSDQWGNIVNGIELARRVDGRELFGFTTPLITTASGAKMGKTAAGAIWLSPHRLSAWDYWQFWRNTEDADVGRFLRLFTDLPLAEVARLEGLAGAEINEAKKVLATAATALLHGREAAERAEATARETFEQGGTAASLPTVDLPRAELEPGIPAFRLLARAGLVASNGEGRRLIQGGGGRLNDERIDDAERPIGLGDVPESGTLKLSAGKKRHILVRPV
ncbi:MAG: tyrosine--tRNA ligase [Azospirillaceae bacterium]